MKKILSAMLVIIMSLSIVSTAFAENGAQGKNVLRFSEDGKFKILILADIQDSYPISKDFLVYLGEALDKAKPDLVVLLGDNVMGSKSITLDEYWQSYADALSPMTERGIPFTLVFGNHDDETMPEVTIEEKFARYCSFDNCLAYDAVPEMHGTGTHNLEILSSDGSKTAFNLWLMDCGDYEPGRTGKEAYYDYIHKDQLDWYVETSKELEARNGAKVPSFMFQHIVPAEVGEKVMVTLPFRIGDTLGHFEMDNGKTITYLPNIFGFTSGMFKEGVSPSRKTDGQWDVMAERGDVLADFFGHDHMNTFATTLKGIDAVNVPSCSYDAYHIDMFQGAMLLTLDESDLSKYKIDMIYSSDLALEEGSQLPGLSRNLANYKRANTQRKIFEVVLNAVHTVTNYFAKLIYRD